jgi:hypothetical protein
VSVRNLGPWYPTKPNGIVPVINPPPHGGIT